MLLFQLWNNSFHVSLENCWTMQLSDLFCSLNDPIMYPLVSVIEIKGLNVSGCLNIGLDTSLLFNK